MADTHFFVEKGERKGRTFTDVRVLSPEERNRSWPGSPAASRSRHHAGRGRGAAGGGGDLQKQAVSLPALDKAAKNMI